MINNDIKKIILEQSDQRKAEIACELNRWKWPVELKDFDPGDYSVYARGKNTYKEGIDIMQFIEHIIGHKAFLKEWNKDSMTEKQFEKWYKKHAKISL